MIDIGPLYTKLGFVATFAGVAMLIVGSLPQDKMDKVRAFLGDTKEYNNPGIRLRLLVSGAASLIIGLAILQVIF